MDQSGLSAFSDSSGFPFALAFPVIPAFRRFRLSGHYFNCLVVSSSCKQKRNKKEAQRTIHCVLRIVKDIAC
jgi:hypothetical protein